MAVAAVGRLRGFMDLQAELYVGLLVFVGYILVDTQVDRLLHKAHLFLVGAPSMSTREQAPAAQPNLYTRIVLDKAVAKAEHHVSRSSSRRPTRVYRRTM